MFRKLAAFFIILFKMARAFVTNGVKPAVAAVSAIRAVIEDKKHEVITYLRENLSYTDAQITVLANAMRKLWQDPHDAEASDSEIITKFVVRLRGEDQRIRKLFYFALATEYAVILHSDHNLKDYEIDTITQLWFAARKEDLRVTGKF